MIDVKKINELKSLEERSKRSILKTLVDYFTVNAKKDFLHLINDLKQQEHASAGARAHALKSCCGNLGFNTFSQTLSLVEQHLNESENKSDFASCLEKTENMYQQLDQAIEELVRLSNTG